MINKTSKKEITNNELADSISGLADLIIKRFNNTDLKLGIIEHRVNIIDERIDLLEQTMESNHGNTNRSINWLTERLAIIMKFLNKKFQVEFPK